MKFPYPQSLVRRRLLRVLLVAWFLPAIAVVSRADIAVLREKGPKSGSVFSNLGIAATPPQDLKVTMETADVKIRLRSADGGNLAADCVATFELVDHAAPETGPKSFLVAFPVTGLRSKIVTVDQFRVTVDGKEPATVLRRAIEISRRQYKLEDSPVHGQLEAVFAPEKEPDKWAVFLADKTGYNAAYVWQQSSQPGAKTHVSVSYSTTLRPQSIHYSKSYDSAADDNEVIPFNDLPVDKWNDQYFFFDYVLLSGATWDGPIGRETIEISSDPALHLEKYRFQAGPRKPIGYRPRNSEPHGGGWSEPWEESNIKRLEFVNVKPGCDLLLAIPVSAVNLQAPVSSK